MSIVNGNPFNGDRQTQWPNIHEDESRLLATIPFSATENMANKSLYKPKGMSHSRSENSVAFITSSNPKSVSRLNVSTHKQIGSYSKPGEGATSPLPSPTRGRAPNRAPSPIKYIEGTGEESMVEIPQSPTKRPRSPMKKMFGENGWLGRSTSMKELPSEQYRKTGLKHWGGKIKQRVGDLVITLQPLHDIHL